jgi:hypothetical protein
MKLLPTILICLAAEKSKLFEVLLERTGWKSEDFGSRMLFHCTRRANTLEIDFPVVL